MQKNYRTFYTLICLFIYTNAQLFAQKTTSISEKTQGMDKRTGFFTYYWDAKEGKIWMEIDKFASEFLYIFGFLEVDFFPSKYFSACEG